MEGYLTEKDLEMIAQIIGEDLGYCLPLEDEQVAAVTERIMESIGVYRNMKKAAG